jgi:hypothetical protein
MHHLFIRVNPRNVPFFYLHPQHMLARTLRRGSRNLAAQNGVLHSIFFKIDKTLWVFLPHVLFMLPCSIFRTIASPLNLYQPYGFVPGHFEFLAHDVYGFHLEIPFVLYLDYNPINYVVRVRHIFI